MANPFYGNNHWNPIRHGYYPQVQIQPQATKPKIVNIPVLFVGSDGATSKPSPSPSPASVATSALPSEETRIAAAVTIQRAVRGFLVRKNARVVRQVAKEVEEIERKVREEETKIRLDSRERLLVSEMLMALLLRLDAVRGVRDFRKRVIKRVVNLQEAIDSISAAAEGPISAIGMSEDQKGLKGEVCEDSSRDHENREDQICNQDEEMNDNESGLEVRIPLAVDSSKINSNLIETADGTISASDPADGLDASSIEVTEETLTDHENAASQTIVLEEESNKVETELEMEIPAEIESPVRQSDLISGSDGMTSVCNVAVGNESAVDLAAIDHEKKSTQTLNLEEDTNEPEAVSEIEIQAAIDSPKRKSNLIGIEKGEDESGSPELEEEITKDEEGGASMVEAKREEEGGMKEMVERMTVENERLKEMVAQLCATSSEQCRLMKGLVDRVEQLERAVHHRMDRRKKRRSATACSALSSAK